MKRVALVTEGIRSIGAAISQQLKEEGDTVSAIYHGNDSPAEAFRKKSGISLKII